ncbi:MAG: hypothetical protein U9O98_09720 [Asgard group archaeon]|nr:hypothetical protein [Asgard group archaeon]
MVNSVENSNIAPSQQQGKRLASLDFQRGLAIWIMTLLHSFEHLYDYGWVKKNPESIFDLPKIVLIVGLFIGFFASFNSYFLLISSTVNALSVSRKVAGKKMTLNQVITKQILTGIALVVISILNSAFGYRGYIGTSLRTGNWGNITPMWKDIFTIHTLEIIGWSIVINAIILGLLFQNEGVKKLKRNLLIYAGLFLGIVIATPFIHTWIDNLAWSVPTNPPEELADPYSWPSPYFQYYNASFKAWLCKILAGDMEPFFPYLATSFAGSIIGLSLAQDNPPKKLSLYGAIGAGGCMGFGGLFIGLNMYNLSNHRSRLGNYLLLLGAQIGIVMLLLWLVEFRGKSNVFAQRPIVKHFRLWGMVSLSIYCLQIIEIFPRWLLTIFLGLFSTPINLLESSVFGFGQEYLAVLVSIYIICFFEFIVYLWSQSDFKFSFEWFIIRLASLSSNKISNRLDVDLLMNKMNWYDYTIPKTQKDSDKKSLAEAVKTSNLDKKS